MKIIEFLKEVIIGILQISLGIYAVLLVFFAAISLMSWGLQQGWELITLLILISAIAGIIMGAIVGKNFIE